MQQTFSFVWPSPVPCDTFSPSSAQLCPSLPPSLRYVNDNVKRDGATSSVANVANVVASLFCFLRFALSRFARSIPSAIRRRTCEAREAVASLSTPSNFLFYFPSFIFCFFYLSYSINLLFINPIMVYLFLSVVGNYGELESLEAGRG